MHPTPVPFLIESQHDTTCPFPQDGAFLSVWGARLGRALAATAMERRPKRVLVCILVVDVGVKGLVGLWELRSGRVFVWVVSWVVGEGLDECDDEQILS